MPNDGRVDEMLQLLESLRAQAEQLEKSDAGATASNNPIAELRWGDPIAVNYVFERILFEDDDELLLLVRHRVLDRCFAMKTVPETISQNEEVFRQLKRNAEAVARLGDESIVFIASFGHSPRVGDFYVMEYLNGTTLSAELLGGTTIPSETLFEIAAQLGAALSVAHDVGLAHRDINPTNVMSHRVDGELVWKFLKFAMNPEPRSSQDALREYLAPELLAGGASTPASDQFAFAATLFRAMFGAPPWREGESRDAPLQFPEPATQNLELTNVLSRALAADPKDRFPSVDDFVAALLRQDKRPQRPRIAPHEVFEARRVLDSSPRQTTTTVSMAFDQPKTPNEPFADPSGSLEVSFADISALRPTVVMNFQSARRLRREWRKNLIGFAALIPTERRVKPGSPLRLQIDLAPAGESASFLARVTSRVHYPVLALAVEIEAEDRDALHEYISGLDLASFPTEARFKEKGDAATTRLSSDESFVFDKLSPGMSVGELRRQFANLPLAIDDVIARLEEKKLIKLDVTEPTHVPAEPVVTEAESVSLVLERAKSLREQGNQPGEMELLTLAAERYQSAELFRRLAVTHLQVNYDLPAAIASLERALELDPQDVASAERLESLRKFSSFEPNV